MTGVQTCALPISKSRDIYNNIVAEEMDEEVEENFDMSEGPDSMDQTDDMMHDIEADHDGMDSEDDGMDMHSDDLDMGDAGEEGEEHEAGEEDVEDRVMDLEDALEDLKAEFEKLMSQEQEEPEHAEEGVVREYVEDHGQPYKQDMNNPHGRNVGADTGAHEDTGEKNTKSVVAGKNDMGGTAKNLAQGFKNEDPDGKEYKGPKNEYSKGETKFPHNGKFLKIGRAHV